MSKGEGAEEKWKKALGRVVPVLRLCGAFVSLLGVVLFLAMAYSIAFPEHALKLLLGDLKVPLKAVAGSSWAQVAVAFGMHSFADINAGLAMMRLAKEPTTRLSPQVTVWNTSRFVISFLWMLKIAHGLFHLTLSKAIGLSLSPAAMILLALLTIDAVIVRPVAVYMQRALNDGFAVERCVELKEHSSLSFLQKCCRFVFYYEAVLSGCSGATYFMFPELFYYLYGYPTAESDAITLWCLSQFGVLVMIFGLYQMSCEIDQNRLIVLWWLILDIVWLYVYWQGTAAVLGPWNPLTFSGANFWCHSAWHADSTLAIARIIYLLTPSQRVTSAAASGKGKKDK